MCECRCGWISVKDELPKSGTFCMVFDSDVVIGGVLFSDSKFTDFKGELYLITHWMPLPEAPYE